MKEYNLRDFILYYQDAFIVDHLGRVGKLWYDRENDGLLRILLKPLEKPISHMTLDEIEETCPIVDHTQLEWENVRRPRLGYRHMKNGKVLFRAVISRLGGTQKGLNARNVSLEVPREFHAAASQLGNIVPTLQLGFQEAIEIHRPNFIPSLSEAVQIILENKDSVGLAISHNVAVTLGPHEDSAFVMLFNGDKIGSSKDGTSWELISDEYEGVLRRHVR